MVKIYKIFNTASIISIVVLKNFVNVKKLVTAYTIIDAFLFLKKDLRKTNQLLLHHIAIATIKIFKKESKVGIVSLKIIESLGFVWTLEILKVPKKLLRPCVMSIVCSSFPIFKRTINSKMYLLAGHLFLLNISSILHHSNHVVTSNICNFDNIICRTFAVHIFLISPDKILFIKHLAVIKGFHLLTHTANQDDSSRDYQDILNVLPTSIMHFFTFYSIQHTLFDIPLQIQHKLV